MIYARVVLLAALGFVAFTLTLDGQRAVRREFYRQAVATAAVVQATCGPTTVEARALKLALDGWSLEAIVAELCPAQPSAPEPEPEPEPAPAPPRSAFQGPLRFVDDVFVDDSGHVLPLWFHYGDALAVWVRDPGRVAATLDLIAAAGYHGVRAWTVLDGSFWAGRDVGPWTPDYRAHLTAFQDALRARGLTWLVSQGDLWQLGRAGRDATRDALLATLDRSIVAAIDAGNEPINNGNGQPAELREWIAPFLQRWPDLAYSLGAPIGEEKADLDRYAGNVYDVHGYRGGRWWDKIRHIFSLAYEIRPVARVGIQSEPFGPGPFVSVTDNKGELDGAVMAAAAVESYLARQAWVYFPGFEKDTGDPRQAGFVETPRAVALLPRDLFTFQTLVHGGSSQAARRVFAVTDEDGDRTMRCDQALHNDGRFLALCFGPNLSRHRQERGTVQQQYAFGDKAVLYLGRR